MAWKEVTTDELAKSLGVSASEVQEKQKLVELIIKTRKSSNISQTVLAKKLGVTQSRIAQIESGIGTSKITFDVLFNILRSLGLSLKITAKKVA
jgi:transcriptional regulator with XRE-family HTH domain